MTVTPQITVSDGRLAVRERTVLAGVPENVAAAHASGAGLVDGAFVGVAAAEAKSHHVFTFGTLRDCRFMCLFRFKLWWMTQRMGSSGRDVPLETQFIIIEVPADRSATGDDGGEPVYVVMLPLLEGQFRTVLQGNDRDELEICIESGDKAVQTEQAVNAVYVHAGANPFDTITQAVKAVEKHMQTFHHREKKKLPSFLDWFGWCTWDAFYTDVTADSVKQGLRSLAEGGAPPRFLIIDDGWQQIGSENKDDPSVSVQEGAQFASRLTGIKENTKFQNKKQQGIDGEDGDKMPGLKQLVEETKEEHGMKSVYVWHAMAGYWGGVKPSAAGMERYEAALAYPVQSPGVMGNQPDIVMDSLSVLGLGLVHPRMVHSFYGELHAYLAGCGVDGVKVDVQNIIETLGAGHGGRVQLTRQYHQALDASVAKNFPENGIIACMSHNTDALYCSKQTAVVRASDDFFPREPVSHTIHIAAVAYNSVFLGEFMLPDWDMFHSLHPAGDYHGSARAISGGPVYVSDAPGKHNFELLKKIVLPDGSLLRARLPGRPTKDCLFSDPARDGVSLLKIWNMNKFTGVVGVYNCQGAAWSSVGKKNVFHHTGTEALTCGVKGGDVHLISEATTDPEWNGDCAVFRHASGDLVVLPNCAALPISLKVLEHDVLTVSPIKDLAPGFRFAPIGLVDMFNSGAAVEGLTYHLLDGGAKRLNDDGDTATLATGLHDISSEAVGLVCMEVRGCGRFGVYSSVRPRKCMLGSAPVEFSYDPSSGLVILQLEAMPTERVHKIVVEL